MCDVLSSIGQPLNGKLFKEEKRTTNPSPPFSSSPKFYWDENVINKGELLSSTATLKVDFW